MSIKESIRELVRSILNRKPAAAKEQLSNIMSGKVNSALNTKKQEISRDLLKK
jgi:hypothetical protein